ncbi:MAG: ABC transporter ATP-binding protein [Clostridiales bacterium]|nr:ABC transporter ATP-binding protein [Clostridiales bacterium]
MKTVLRFLKPYKTKILLVILCMAAEAAGGLLIPTVTADIINNGIAGSDLDCILRRGALMLVIAAAAALAALGASYTAAAFSAGFGRDLRCAVYDKTLTFSADDTEHFGTGTLITRTLSDVSIVQQTTVMLLQGILPVPLVCAAGIFLAFRIERTAGFLLLGLSVLILAASVLVMRRTTPLFEMQQRFLDRMNLSVRESITGVRVVRAFNKENAEAKRLGGIFDGYRGVSIRANRMFAGLDCTLMLVINLVTVAILWLGADRTGAGLMEIGDISALTQYAAMILFYLLMAQFTLIMIPRAVVCAGRLAEILNRTPSITDPAAAPAAQTGGEEVLCFRDVNFRFADADADALSGINFVCRRGETVAIVGSTGSGKSTVAKLALRLHDVARGEVDFCGTDVRKMAQGDLRRRIAYVPQQAWLFAGTVRSNLEDGADDAAMRHALTVAQADFITGDADGLARRVSQGGTNFSGGQRQRLAIARALMKHADLYIFDDSFSALDFKTDAALRHALAAETKDAAVLIVAQRISTVLAADRIVVLEDGRVAGIGRHEELLGTCAVYRDIVASQMKGGATHGCRI